MKFIKKNKNNIIFVMIGFILGLLIMSFNIKDVSIPLKDGTTPIISLEEIKITSDEYYNNLKENVGIDLLLDLIDHKLLDDKYSLNEDELEKIKNKMQESIKAYTNYYNVSKEEFLSNTGFKNEEDFYNYLILEEKRNLYEKDYLKDETTNNEVNYYYLNKMENDFEIMYIKGKEEELSNILKDLKNGATYEEIIKNNKKITYKNLGYISFDDEKVNSDIYSDALKLEENSYTTSLRSINNEYYIIFKGKIKEKDDIDNLRERIRNKIVEEKIQSDEDKTLYQEALIHLRKENNITFYDTYLENLYEKYSKK